MKGHSTVQISKQGGATFTELTVLVLIFDDELDAVVLQPVDQTGLGERSSWCVNPSSVHDGRSRQKEEGEI